MPVVGTKAAASSQGFGEFAATSTGSATYIEDVFSTWLYEGNGSTQTITNGIDLAGKGGLVWTKVRSTTYSHFLADTIRGAGSVLSTNNTNAADTGGNLYSGFNTNGYGVTTSYGSGTNGNGATYASWTFRKQPKFFDVVTYTGDGTNYRDIPHSLGSTPGCVIVKQTSAAGNNWRIWHRSLTSGYMLAFTTDGEYTDLDYITGATSTTFQVGTRGGGPVNASGSTYVAYLFAHNAGGFGLTGTDNVISCGSYTGTGAALNVSLGYEPQWILIKDTSATGNWRIFDNMRGWPAPSGQSAYALFPNLSNAETDNGDLVYPNATGFQLSTNGTYNTSGRTYIYIAIRRGPMKTPTSGTSVFKVPYVRTGGGATQDITAASYPVNDLVITKSTSNTQTWAWTDRLRGATKELTSASTAAEATYANDLTSFAFMNGFQVGSGAGGQMNTSGYTYIDYTFRRAPGFFDEVCYTGTGGNPQTVNHNLGVAPNMVIVKRRDNATPNWTVGLSFTSTPYQDGLYLNATNALIAGDNELNGASATTISVRNTLSASGGTFVAYLFATCPGVSKVGSFTGTGNVLQVDCGFTGGARFVLIKATSTTGSWYVWDSARGIVAGNDPYLLLNSTAAEVTNTDWVDAYSAGFELSNAVGNTVNTNGTTYMYLAIA